MGTNTSTRYRDEEDQVQRWLQAAQNGSNSGLGQLLEACRGYMLLVANQAIDSDLRQKTAASDLVQETFFDAHRGFGQFRGTTEREFFAWLTQILINRLRNAARQYRDTQMRDVGREIPLDRDLDRIAAELMGNDDTPSALVAALEEEQIVRECMDRLPATQREVLILRSWENQSFSEIGLKMDRSADAVRKLWTRAVERLGRELEKVP